MQPGMEYMVYLEKFLIKLIYLIELIKCKKENYFLSRQGITSAAQCLLCMSAPGERRVPHFFILYKFFIHLLLALRVFHHLLLLPCKWLLQSQFPHQVHSSFFFSKFAIHSINSSSDLLIALSFLTEAIQVLLSLLADDSSSVRKSSMSSLNDLAAL